MGGVLLQPVPMDSLSRDKPLILGGVTHVVSGDYRSMLAVGDRVLLAAWSGTRIDVDGEELRLIYEDAILAVEVSEKKARTH